MFSSALQGKSNSSMMIFDVIVIGGGISGLYVANGLIGNQHVKDWKLLEASDRLGGRLRNASPSVSIDMGGAWIWPSHQPHNRDLVTKLHLSTFTQPDDPHSTRIEGGAIRIVEKLFDQIQNSQSATQSYKQIQLNTPVVSCKLLKQPSLTRENQDLVELTTSSGETFVSRKVVFAIPPKAIHDNIAFDPVLSKAKMTAMSTCSTWMANMTKVALVYPTKFWTADDSSSGLPASMGPAQQVYDSCTQDGHLAALTFFVHVPDDDDNAARTNDALLANQVAQQISKVWQHYGKLEEAKAALLYSNFYVYRWPMHRYISGDDTRTKQIHTHPLPVRALSTLEWDDRLYFAGSETDLTSPGVMEGALGSAKRVLKSLLG
jgi:monoamine oxidase